MGTTGYRHIWAQRVIATYGHNGLSPRMGTTGYRHVWAQRVIATYGHNGLLLCMGTTGYRHVWAQRVIATYGHNGLLLCMGTTGYRHVWAQRVIATYGHNLSTQEFKNIVPLPIKALEAKLSLASTIKEQPPFLYRKQYSFDFSELWP